MMPVDPRVTAAIPSIAAKRLNGGDLQQEISSVIDSPVMQGVLSTAGGMVAVLNRYRQVVAVNRGLLENLGVEDSTVLGLRPGEMLGCIQAAEAENGCGTGQQCLTCGAAISIVASRLFHQGVEQKCILPVMKRGVKVELCFGVRCAPISLGNEEYGVLYLEDLTAEENRLEMERAFFHDITNMVMAMEGAAHYLANHELRNHELGEMIHHQTSRLSQEVRLHRSIAHPRWKYEAQVQQATVARLLHETRSEAVGHPAARHKELVISAPETDMTVATDIALFHRVLGNMLINAFEATPRGGEVRLEAKPEPGVVVFSVWNAGEIPPEVQCRIFQHYFSTKKGSGRGIGTYMMKRFGEEYLGGRVGFTSSRDAGTCFTLTLRI